jgi:hypothetical protein
MKDITSTTFGLIIAFFLPGSLALYSIAYWVPQLQEVFAVFTTAESNIGLFFLVAFFALALGLEITVFRWFLFENLILKNHKLDLKNFTKLTNENSLAAFRANVDEHYRYHQFWGGLVFVLPLLYFGWIRYATVYFSLFSQISLAIFFILVEALTIIAANKAYIYYVQRGNAILKGE